VLGRRAVIVFLGLLLTGCAVSETRSIVDKEHLPATRYQKVALFIEGVDEPERTAAEQIVLSTFQSAGLNTESALAFFAKRGQLSDQAKASIIQKQFDAVLYLKVVQKGIAEELVPNARSDGQYIVYKLGIVNFGAEIPEGLIIKPDGSVYSNHPIRAADRRVFSIAGAGLVRRRGPCWRGANSTVAARPDR
jgi:hypothetical protein